jgi:hypothetical protein
MIQVGCGVTGVEVVLLLWNCGPRRKWADFTRSHVPRQLRLIHFIAGDAF